MSTIPATLHCVVNGRAHSLPSGLSVLHALRRIGVDVPALCDDERLKPTGACRSCLVDIAGSGRPVPACTMMLADGMEIRTDSPALQEFRRFLLASLAQRSSAGSEGRPAGTPFQRLLDTCGVAAATGPIIDAAAADRSHPFITVDMTQCIDCYRCVRICDELQGQHVWHIQGRGSSTRVVPSGPNLRESGCVGCGACVDTCPTGALLDANAHERNGVQTWTRTTCPYCGVGCEMSVGARNGRIVAVDPVLDAPVSKGHLCVKGRYGFAYVAAADRITEPMIRRGQQWTRVSWAEALAFTADRLQSIVGAHGPDSVAMLGSARATNEDNYVAQKFARVVLGTNNVDCCARVCHAPSAAGLKRMLGAGLATNAFDDIERAATILVCGANPTENHPVVGARIKQAVRRGARLLVIDPRRIELAAYADCHLAIRPGTNIPLLNAMAHTILAEGLTDHEFVAARVSGLDELTHFLAGWTPERAAAICGVSANAIRDAARIYAGTRPSLSVHGLGLTEHVQGTDGVMALINLALLTGNIGRPGSGVNPLRGQNNVQGAAHMGCDPDLLPGSTPIADGRLDFERAWNHPLPRPAGLRLPAMMDAALAGRLKALWAIGYDVLLTNPQAAETARALGALGLVIVQDLFMTATAREFGTVFLPACASFEKDGTFMNAERRIQRVRQAVKPAGASRTDWSIVCGMAAAMGRSEGFGFDCAEDIWNEVRGVCDGARGMSYARLDATGLQWPCPDEQHPGTPMLHTNAWAGGGKAALQRIEWQPGSEASTAERPFALITGRLLYQFNAGTMTARTPLLELQPADVLDMSPADGERLGLREGDGVSIESAHGSATLPVHFTTSVADGQLFATFHTAAVFLNRVTGPLRDPVVGTPQYKLTAVQVRPLSARQE